MTSPSTVLVLGASGRFGSACVKAFAAAGWRVLAQQRRTPAERAVPGVERLVTGDAPLAQAFADIASGSPIDVVVHAINPPYNNAAWIAQSPVFMAAAIGIAKAHNALLMLPGNVYNFGAQMPAVLSPQTPIAPTAVKGQVRVALEAQLKQAAQAGGMRGVVIRAGDFFGSGSGAWFDRLIAKDLKRGRMGYPGPLDVATPWAYLPDLAEAFVRVAAKTTADVAALPNFETLHFAGHHLTGLQWLALLQPIAQAQGWVGAQQRLKTTGLPWPLIRAGAVFNPEWAALSEMRYLYQTPHALDGSRLAALIGPEPRTPIGQALGLALTDLSLLSASPRAAAVA